MALTPDVILTVFSTGIIVTVSLILLNEISDKKLVFKRPSLSLVKEEYHKVMKKI